MADTYDGSVRINTKIDEKGFNVGMKKLRASAVDAMNSILFATLKVVEPIVNTFRKIGAAGAAIFKKLLVGGLLVFALTAAKVFASLRESLQEAIDLKGGKTKEDFEQLKNSFTELRASIAAAFLPLVEIAIPYIQMALDWLIKFFNQVAMITAAFAGQKTVMQVVAGSAAKLAKETEKTKKNAQGALAAFDQINVLAQKTTETNAPKVETNIVPITNDILSKVQAIKDEIAAWFDDPIGKLQETWGKIKDWFSQNVIEPVSAKWREFWDDPQNKLAAFNSIVAAFTPFPAFFLEHVLLPVEDYLADFWAVLTNDSMTTKEKLTTMWGMLIEDVKAFLNNFVAWFLANVTEPLRSGFNIALEWIGGRFQAVFTGIQNFVYNTINKILGFINDMINSILGGIASVMDAAGKVGGAFSMPSAGAGIGGVIGGLLSNIKIPGLATGGIVPAGANMLARVGEREAEAVIPLSQLEEVLNRGGGGDQTINVTATVDGEVLFKVVEKVKRRHGTSLIAGGTA